jgi:DNA-binding MarR family transcriptional regulator
MELGEQYSAHAISALASISVHGPTDLTTLAQVEGISQATMSVMAERLAADGLIKKLWDTQDRRRVRLTVTASGLRLLEATRKHRDAYLVRRFETLTVAEIRTIDRAATILERLMAEDRIG